MVKRTASGRARGTADAAPAIAELCNLTKAIGEIVSAAYGPEMRFSDRDALAIAEPLGRMVSRYAGATERLRELSDPVLLAGAIAGVAWPRIMRVTIGRAMGRAQEEEQIRQEVTFSETRTVRDDPTPREYVNTEHLNRTLRRMQSVQ